VIISSFNGETVLPTQLLALERQDFDGPFEVLICDNGSTDRTREVAEKWAPRLPGLRVLEASEIAGSGFAQTVGIINAAAPLLAFCDQDDYVLSGWLTAIRDGLADHDVVTGPLGRVVHDFDKVDPLDVVGTTTFGGPLDNSIEGLQVAPGGNSGWRRSAAAQGRVDSDTITSLRATARGIEIGWCDDARVLYRRRPPGSKVVQRAITSGVWYAEIDREFGGVLYPARAKPARMVASLCLRFPAAAVRGNLADLRWPLGAAIGVILERTLPGFWWGRIRARRLAGKTDRQVFTTGAGG